MRSTRRSLNATILSLLLTLSATAHSVRAEDDYADEYDVKARVARISLIKGEVSLRRNGNSDWERARLNLPLVEGDTVSTDRESRLEIQIDARNFVRLEANSILRIVTLRDEGVALSVVEGTASVRLAKFDSDREYFEVDAPKTTMAAEKKGLYRIDVARDGRVRLTARDGGRARIYSETSGFTLRDGRTAELIFEGADAGDWELLTAGPRDSWDSWIADRELYLAQRMRYDNKYYDNYVWGAEELDAYGAWSYANDYGWIWQPHVTIINNYPNWAPYRHGYWTWCPPYGWTWVGYEPWGWAPYHYGRWVYHNNYWAWCPRSQYYRHRSWWRPALVAFHISFGDHVSWYPLSYHHRDPRSRHYRDRDRLSPMRERELANLRRVNPAHLRAVTSARAADFGGSGRFQTADQALARRVMSGEPVRGDLPLRPARVSGGGANSAASRDSGGRMITARPARVTPILEATDRQTGAAARTPGVSLDNDLRRTRILNGREPRTVVSADNATPDTSEARPTGAVVRPARPARVPVDRPDQRTAGAEAADNSSDRPVRPARTYPQQDRPVNADAPDINDSSLRERRPSTAPVRPPASEIETPAERPARPERTNRPERNERPARPERNQQPVEMNSPERPEHRGRTETPAPRPDPPARSYEPPPPRSAPAPREERPQRYEPPPRHDPPPRSDPPPQRSEPAPQRSEPPPQRSEPAPQRSEPAPQRSDPPDRSEPSRPERARPPLRQMKRER
jgi:hypothetical protein